MNASAAQRLVAGKYRVVSKLGSGGSATVSLAVAQGIAGFSKLVVLKAIRDTIKPGSRAIDGFLDEARLSARLNHPNVVQVYEVVEHEGLPVIVMEYLDGPPLAALLLEAQRRPDFSLELRLTLATKVLAGLHHAHELRDFSGRPLGLVHRDVSPHNVMVTYDGLVKLVDFGIAQLGTRAERPSKRVPGKLAYMAPEQMHGVADRRADVFAAGILLWELITLQRFWGVQSEAAVMRQLLAFDLPHRGTPTPDMDADLGAICARALAADPRDRPATAAELQAELEHFLRTHSGVVVESSIGQLVQRAFAPERVRSQRMLRVLLRELDAPLLQARGGGAFEQRRSARDGDAGGPLVAAEAPRDEGSGELGSSPGDAGVLTVATHARPRHGSSGPRALAALLCGAFALHAGDGARPAASGERGKELDRPSPAATTESPDARATALEAAPVAATMTASAPTPALAPLVVAPAPRSPRSATARPAPVDASPRRERPRSAKPPASIELEPGADLRQLRQRSIQDARASGGWR